MHIVDGVLSHPVLITGAVATTVGVAVGLRQMTADKMPVTAILTSVFFVASLIHVPVGPSSVHMILNGLMGMILGWSAFPAIVIALLLQAVFFGFGGLSVLGVNALNLALPAILIGFSARLFINRIYHTRNGQNGILKKMTFLIGLLVGSLSVGLTSLGVAASLALAGEGFIAAAKLTLLSHLPVMVLEGILTAVMIGFLLKVKPTILGVQADQPHTKQYHSEKGVI